MLDLKEAAFQTIDFFRTMFGSPKGSGLSLWCYRGSNFFEGSYWQLLELLLVTLSLAFLTTLIGGIIAIILGLFAAKNLTNSKVSNTIKSLVAVVRAVPTVSLGS
jgi:phosphonate transport system permease protein